MKSYPAPPIPEAIVSDIRHHAASGAAQESLIRKMRDSGLNVIASIKLLADVHSLSISDAKHAVHLSPTWSDCRASHDVLHDASLQAVQELDREKQAIAG